ncbi:MAG: nucleoside hydrolase [Bacillota bacterium]|nr:MAG: nucleoside hydrolase [Bacillota bacterium]
MPKKVILDVDTGCDDAVAILLALNSPELEVLAIGTTHGNVEAELAALNTLRVLEWVGRDDIPVAVGAAAPLCQPLRTARWVHGEDGLGNLHLPPPRRQPTGEHAADQIVRLARQHPGEVTLIATGPLTNLALALAKEPRLPELIREVILMGGSAFAGGNLSPWAEANIGHDPEAAAAVFAAPWPVTMVGLDVTMAALFTRAIHEELGRCPRPGAQLAYRVLAYYLDFYDRVYGRGGCAQHDALAVAVAIDPSLVEAPLLPVQVETRGEHTRGMTVVDRRALLADRVPELFPDRDRWHVRVALKVDGERFLSLLLERLTR